MSQTGAKHKLAILGEGPKEKKKGKGKLLRQEGGKQFPTFCVIGEW